MSLLNKGTVIAIAEETTLGGGKSTAWAQGDAVPFNDDSGLTPATATLERNVFNGSFLDCQALAGEDSTSGNLNLDFSIAEDVTAKGKLVGHLLYKNGFGKYVIAGADVDKTNFKIEEDALAGGDYDLYTFNKPEDTRTTLAVKEYLGGTGNTLLHKGCVVESLQFDFSAGQIVKVTNSIGGIAYTTATDETPLASTGCGDTEVFVTKNAILKVDGVTLNASDVSLSITNELVDRKYITSSGIGDKVMVRKSAELSYTVDLGKAEMAYYDLVKTNATGELYLELATSGGDEAVFYFPKVTFSNPTKNNDGGVLTLQITSNIYENEDGDAILLATKKG